MTPDLGAPRTRARGQRMRGERRIHVPVIRLVDRAEQAVHSRQRIDPGQLLGGEDPEFMAHELSEPLHVTKLRHPLGPTGDAQCPARMEAGRLAGLGRQHVPVQTHRGRAHLHDGGVWAKWVQSPAACQVEPAVSSLRSRSTTSRQPRRVRW